MSKMTIDFSELEKHIPTGGSLALTVKRCDGSVVSTSETDDKAEGNQVKENAVVELELVVAATIFSKSDESTPVTLRGTSVELSAHFFEHFTDQVEKMSLLQQIESQQKDLDRKISKGESDLKAKNNKLTTAKAKGPQANTTKTAEKKDEKKVQPKEEKKPASPCIDLFGDSALSGSGSQEKTTVPTEQQEEVVA